MVSQPETDKLFVLLRFPENAQHGSVHQQLREVLAANPTPFQTAQHLTFCPIGPPPAGLPRRPDDTGNPKPAYDAAIIAEFASSADAKTGFDQVSALAWLPSGLYAEIYLVQPTPVIERMTKDVLPAIKYLALNIFHDDLPDSAAQRSWAQHAKLAGIVHTGAGRYARNWVVARSPQDLPVRGIVEIDFASLADLTERYFGIPGGMERIIQDVGHFLQKGFRLYTPPERIR